MSNPIAEYATPEQQRRFPLADYLTFFAIAAFTIGVLAAPLLLIERLKRIFEDFKLKLPGPTQLWIDLYDALNTVHARYWIWLVPILLPLWIIRRERDTRFRIAVVMMLLAGCAIVWFVFAAWLPMFTLIDGMTSK
jgi:type II secretory pathway component PulF